VAENKNRDSCLLLYITLLLISFMTFSRFFGSIFVLDEGNTIEDMQWPEAHKFPEAEGPLKVTKLLGTLLSGGDSQDFLLVIIEVGSVTRSLHFGDEWGFNLSLIH